MRALPHVSIGSYPSLRRENAYRVKLIVTSSRSDQLERVSSELAERLEATVQSVTQERSEQ